MMIRTSQLSEAEAIIGTIAQKTSQSRRRKEAMSKLREGTDMLVRSIREELARDVGVSAERDYRGHGQLGNLPNRKGRRLGRKVLCGLHLELFLQSAIDEIAILCIFENLIPKQLLTEPSTEVQVKGAQEIGAQKHPDFPRPRDCSCGSARH
jgi:hypothetical protein